MKPDKARNYIMKTVPAIALVLLSAYLLKGDVWTFWTWYLLAAVLGFFAMPVTGRLFRGFEDKGWMFSKVLAVAVTGFITWFLVSVKFLPFTTVSCVGVTVVCVILAVIFHESERKNGFESLPLNKINLIYMEELLFFAFFLMWTYFAGFHPATDLWYSEGKINYYYGGQYFAVFLTKLSGTKVEMTYNLMRTFVAGLAFSLPCSLVRQMVVDRLKKQRKGWKKVLPEISGILAGISVSVAGNMHYVIYAQIIPFIQKLKGQEVDSYWFPDATRYIGFNPVNDADKTIHEFPCYSFVLGDLHAHVVNIMFVLLLLGLLYSFMKRMRNRKYLSEISEKHTFWKKQLLHPQIIAFAALLGMFHWTNYWDCCYRRCGTVHEYYLSGRPREVGDSCNSCTGSGSTCNCHCHYNAVYSAV